MGVTTTTFLPCSTRLEGLGLVGVELRDAAFGQRAAQDGVHGAGQILIGAAGGRLVADGRMMEAGERRFERG